MRLSRSSSWLVVCVLCVVVFLGVVGTAVASPEPPGTEPATSVFATTAVFNGVIDPSSGVFPVEGGTYQFLYKATKVIAKAECESGGASKVPVSPGVYLGDEPEVEREAVSGLAAKTEYVVCLAVTNAKSETTVGSPVSFKTTSAVAPEAPQATEATEVMATTAALNGVVNPGHEGEPGSVRFVYRQSASECTGAGAKETTKEPAGGDSPLVVSATVSGLLAGKTYSFCVKAFNALGEATLSPAVQFTTSTPPEKPVSDPASEVTATTATLHGELNPAKEEEVGYHFLYSNTGTCAGGLETGQVPVAVVPAKTMVEAKLAGLEPHTKYTVCVVASDAAGDLVPGNEVSLETSEIPPGVSEEEAAPVTFDSATLQAKLNPNNQKTSYSFEYSTQAAGETLQGTVTTLNGAAPLEGFTEQAASVETGAVLSQDTTYFYRLSATNAKSEQTKGKVQHFTTLPEAPENVQVSEVTGSTAKLEGVVNPKSAGEADATYEFLYQASESECENASKTSGTSTGASPETVHAQLTGLIPNTKYTVCLLVRNGEGQTAKSEPPVSFQTPAAPIIEGGTALNETGEGATLQARINPDGTQTKYTFQYGTNTTYGQSQPVPEALIPAGSASVPVTATLTGLAAHETYHWRVAATNTSGTTFGVDHSFIISPEAGGSSECPDETVREQDLSTELPECRAYEMVTPPQKNGALINSLFAEDSQWGPLIAGNGTDIMAPSIQCFAGTEGCTGVRIVEGEPYEFARTSQGWATHPLAPPATQFGITSQWGANADTHTTLFSAASTPESPDVFYRREGQGQPTPIGPLSEGFENTEHAGPGIEGLNAGAVPIEATSDFSHMVFIGKSLWLMTDQLGEGIDEYTGTGNTQPLSVGVTGSVGSTSLVSKCETNIGANEDLEPGAPYGSLSEDGHVVFFTAMGHSETGHCPEGESAPATNELFARVDGEGSDAHTVLVSGPTPAACKSVECEENTSVANESIDADGRNAEYAGASNDGSRVLFTSTQQLSDTASQGTGNAGKSCHAAGGAGCNLYESVCAEPCGAPGEEPAAKERQLIDISAGAKQHGGPRVQGVMAISPDGSHVYFIARGKLTSSPGVLPGSEAQEGQDNLYAYIEGQPLKFIATLPASDENELNRPESRQEFDRGIELANVTPGGRFLVFLSHAALTPDDTQTEGPAQIFRYDAETGTIVRISVGEDGFNDDGNAGSELAEPSIVPAEKGWQYPMGPGRANLTMSNDGQDVFFESPVALTPGALNEVKVNSSPAGVHTVYAENIYEYHDGTVSLISNGKDTTPNSSAGGVVSSTRLIGTDSSGENVFFATNSQVIPEDTDTQRDYYDARICKNTDPCVAPPPPPAGPCPEGTCQTPSPAQNPTPLTGSDTLQGTGNLPPGTPPPSSPRPTILTHTVHGTKLTLRIKLTAPGRLTITSSDTTKTSRQLKAGTQTLQITLTPAAQRALRHKHKLTLKLHITYTTPGSTTTSTTTTITTKP
jgi:Fibronectin type III domain